MKFYNISQVAEILNVSEEIMYALCRPDKITGKAALANYRIGTRVIVSEGDIRKYLDSKRIEAVVHPIL